MVFRLTGKQFFLTYPKCDLSKEKAKDLLDSILDPVHLIIARELHSDQTYHLHIYVKNRRKINVKRQDYFDLDGYHGNYQTVRDKNKVVTYVKKGGDFLEEKAEEADESVLDACRTMDPDAFLEWCIKKKIPKGYYDEAIKLCSRTFDIEETDELARGNPTLLLTLTS